MGSWPGPNGPGTANPALDDALATLVEACRVVARELVPFLPDAAARITAQCGPDVLPPATPLFARIE